MFDFSLCLPIKMKIKFGGCSYKYSIGPIGRRSSGQSAADCRPSQANRRPLGPIITICDQSLGRLLFDDSVDAGSRQKASSEKALPSSTHCYAARQEATYNE